jgi:hypothetical protein
MVGPKRFRGPAVVWHEARCSYFQELEKYLEFGVENDVFLSATANELGIPRSTLREHLDRAGVDYRTYLPCRNTPSSKTGGVSNTAEGEEPLAADRSVRTC